MNLFCFSLEGSMDSLYEAVQDSSDGQVYTIPSRSCSPAVMLDDNTKWRGSGRPISMEISQMNTNNSKKKKRRTPVPKSASDNEALELVRALKQADRNTKEDRHRQRSTMKTETEQPVQIVYHEGWNPNQDRPNSRQRDLILTANGEMAEPRGTIKRTQKTGKKGSLRGSEGVRTNKSTVHARGPIPAMACGGGSAQPRAQENATPSEVPRAVGGLAPNRQRWSNPAECAQAWPPSYHTCRRPLTEYRAYSHDFTLPRAKEADQTEGRARERSLRREPSPQGVVRSITDVDLCVPNLAEREDGAENCDQNKPGGLSKTMKALSLTMRKKMGKKKVKAFSEETGEDMEKDQEREAGSSSHLEKGSEKTSSSLESLYSGQSSSSGVTSSSDGCSNRGSLRLEDVPYTGHFCGRARVHTDFVPSPYDTDSLKLKVGDIINITRKPPMGIWTGMLNNKVGNFKFIYVDMLIEEEEKEEEVPKSRPPRHQSKRPRPKTLLELLERLHLEEYASSLLLNGYQTVEDLKHLKETHLIELNVIDPEHRHRLLVAAECLYDTGRNDLGESKDDKENEETNDCPRDSGCFIPSECTDNSKEDIETDTPPADT